MHRSSLMPNDIAKTGVIIGDVVTNQSGGRRSSARARAVQLPSGAEYVSAPLPVAAFTRPRLTGFTPTPCHRFKFVVPSPNHLLMSADHHELTYQDARVASTIPRGDHLCAASYPAARTR